jgi:hypothetical protein
LTRIRIIMKLLSFYLDPVRRNKAERQAWFDAIGVIVKAAKPEFMAFQNVSNDDIKKIMAPECRWSFGYNFVKPTAIYETRMKPAVTLLSKWPAVKEGPLVPTTIDYDDTDTDKFLQKAYYEMNDKNNKPFIICIGTTSLEEDLKATEMREKQLNQACNSLKSAEDAFLIGNFCIDNDIDGDIVFKGGWKDAWLSIPGNTEESGPTYDPDNNPLIKGDQFGPRRPDRLYFKSRHFELKSIEVIGTQPYQPAQGAPTTISKHYGLLVNLTPLDRAKDKVDSPVSAVEFKRSPEYAEHLRENQSS